MAETTADVRRDIELTRERMSDTLAQLERKMNLTQMVKDHPWPALAVAFGAGVLLSGSRADVKAAAATVAATQGASGRLGPVLDDLVANVMTGVTQAFQDRVISLVDEIKDAIGAPRTTGTAGASAGDFGGARQPSAAGSQQFGAGSGSAGAYGSAGTNTGGSAATSESWAPQSAGTERHGAFGGESQAGGNRSLGAMEGQNPGPNWGTPRAD